MQSVMLTWRLLVDPVAADRPPRPFGQLWTCKAAGSIGKGEVTNIVDVFPNYKKPCIQVSVGFPID